MNLKPVSLEDYKSFCTKHAHCKAIKLVEQFQQMPDKMVELEYTDKEYANTNSARSTLSKAIKNIHAGIKVIVRKNHVFLIKEDM